MTAGAGTSESEWTVGRLLTWTTDYLATHGIADARLATEVLLAHAAGCRRIDLYARFEQIPSAEKVQRFRGLVRRAAAHEPIAYLVGEKEFFSLSFLVTPDVLIPRPETETLIEAVLDLWARGELKEPTFLDVGTGSGCIAVTLLVNVPAAKAVATDISAEALKVAKLNADRHGVSDRLTLAQADRLDIPEDLIPAGGFDAVLSNPPYVAADDIKTLDVAVREYEPMQALSDGADGLTFFRSLGQGAPRSLKPRGLLVVEVADDQAPSVRAAVEDVGGWGHRSTMKDRVVGKDRVLVFERR